MRIIVIVFITFAIYAEVNALKCYDCDSVKHGSACLDPINENNINALDCKDVYRYQRHSDGSDSGAGSEGKLFEFTQPEKLQSWNPNMNSNWNPNVYSQPTDFECVQYEQLFNRDSRRVHTRKCLPRNESPNFCAEMEFIGNQQGFKLTKCDVCYSDHCNKSGSIKLSLLLNFAFFLIFYQCTA